MHVPILQCWAPTRLLSLVHSTASNTKADMDYFNLCNYRLYCKDGIFHFLRPLSPTELAVSLNLSTLGCLEYGSQSISGLPQLTTSTPHGSMLSDKLGSIRMTSKATYPCSNLFQCYRGNDGPPDDSQVISDLFFI